MIEATPEVLKEMSEVEARPEKKEREVKSEKIAIEIEMIEAKAIEIEMIGVEVKVIEIVMTEAEVKVTEIIITETKEDLTEENMDESALTEVERGLLLKKRGEASLEMTEMDIETIMTDLDLVQAPVTEIETEEDTTEHQTVAADCC